MRAPLAWNVRSAVLAAVVCLWALTGCSNDPYPPEGDKKILYSAIGEDPHSLDPVQAGDTLSGGIIAQMYDALYEYHFLKRPFELKTALAAEMPQVSDDGLTYTIRVQPGVYFQDDPCFTQSAGKGREVVATDFVYSIKRLADIANQPRGWWLLQGKIQGLDAFRAESVERQAAGEPMDYSMDVAGLQAPDLYTLTIRLTEPFPQLVYVLAMSYTAAVPREAVDYYGQDFVNNPVGTGPFRLKEWHKRWRLILERNPTYREDYYPSEGEPGDAEASLLEDAGRKLPFVDEVWYSVIQESQPGWLLFRQGYLDASGISKDHFQEAITSEMTLTESFRERGIRLRKTPEADVYYVGFNMKDPLVGGDNRKLRQAMSLAYDTQWRIKHLYNGRAIPAHTPLPPGIFGYDPKFQNPYKRYDVDEARRLLAEVGYPGGVGPDGKRLTITYDLGSADPAAEQYANRFAADMEQIGIDVDIQLNTWAEFLRKIRQGRTQVFNVGWILDYPDPENFLQLLYGPNSAPDGPNNCMFDNERYNELFERMKAMPNNEERLHIIREMRDIFVREAPWIPSHHRVSFSLYHQWLRNVKPHGITGGFAKYRDVDPELRRERRREWNRPNYTALAVLVALVVVVPAVLGVVQRHRRAEEHP